MITDLDRLLELYVNCRCRSLSADIADLPVSNMADETQSSATSGTSVQPVASGTEYTPKEASFFLTILANMKNKPEVSLLDLLREARTFECSVIMTAFTIRKSLKYECLPSCLS